MLAPLSLKRYLLLHANDDLCNSVELVVNDPPVFYSNEGATAEDGEPEGTCWLFLGSNLESVWFSFVAPEGGECTVTTDFEGTELHDTHITIFSLDGECSDMTAITEVGCDEDGGFVGPLGWTSIANLSGLTPGDTYYVQVDGYADGDGEFGLQVVTAVGLLESSFDNGFHLYPNPASTDLLIQSDILGGNVIIELFDMNGRLISSENKVLTLGEKTPLNISGLPAGFYSVRLVSEEGTAARRLIIE